MTRWQKPEIQTSLAELSARGLSAGRIAATIGESRNAVKSAMGRYGLFATTRTRSQQPANPQKAE
jgi:hypothetical protein